MNRCSSAYYFKSYEFKNVLIRRSEEKHQQFQLIIHRSLVQEDK